LITLFVGRMGWLLLSLVLILLQFLLSMTLALVVFTCALLFFFTRHLVRVLKPEESK
jgi:hypothetical protein